MREIGTHEHMLYFPYNSEFDIEKNKDDRIYDSQDWADYFKYFLTNGVYDRPENSLKIDSLYNSRVLTLRAGAGLIKGRLYQQERDFDFEIDAAPTVLTRRDAVVLRHDMIKRQITPVYLIGTASVTPVAPALIRTSDMYDLRLCEIIVSANATSINQANIIDTREDFYLCGYVTNALFEGMITMGRGIRKRRWVSGTNILWQVPEGVDEICITACGGGGGGGGGARATAAGAGGAGGGGAGYMIDHIISVVPGEAFTISIGAGGIGGAANPSTTAGANGGDTRIISPTRTITLQGGRGGGIAERAGLGGTSTSGGMSGGRGGNGGVGGNSGGATNGGAGYMNGGQSGVLYRIETTAPSGGGGGGGGGSYGAGGHGVHGAGWHDMDINGVFQGGGGGGAGAGGGGGSAAQLSGNYFPARGGNGGNGFVLIEW